MCMPQAPCLVHRGLQQHSFAAFGDTSSTAAVRFFQLEAAPAALVIELCC
jgi:hypothetical protein